MHAPSPVFICAQDVLNPFRSGLRWAPHDLCSQRFLAGPFCLRCHPIHVSSSVIASSSVTNWSVSFRCRSVETVRSARRAPLKNLLWGQRTICLIGATRRPPCPPAPPATRARIERHGCNSSARANSQTGKAAAIVVRKKAKARAPATIARKHAPPFLSSMSPSVFACS